MRTLILSTLLFISIYESINGQGIFRASNNSILQVQDSAIVSDESKMKLLNAFNFDTNAKSIDYSLLLPLNPSKRRLWLSSDITGKSNSTITNIFLNGNFVPSYKLGIGLVYDFPLRGTPSKNSLNAWPKYVELGKKIQSMYNELAKEKNLIEEKPVKLESKIDILKKYGNGDINEIVHQRDSLKKEGLKETFIYNGIRLGFNYNYEGRGFYNYVLNSTFKDELVERRKNIRDFSAFINYYTLNIFKKTPYIAGLSFSYSLTDNFSTLAEVSVTNTWKSEDGNGTSRSTSQKVTAFEGEYIDTIKQFKFGIDQYFVPNLFNKKLGFSFNYTYNYYNNFGIDNHHDISLGIYLIKDSPFAPLQGFIFKFKDIGKDLTLPESQSRFSIGYTRQLNMYRVLKETGTEVKKEK